MLKKSRILFFDVLRIIFISFVVLSHYEYWGIMNLNLILFSPRIFLTYPENLGSFSVFGMFFISGAVLEYNYNTISTFLEYKLFIIKRFFRLYPPYWMSLLLMGLILLLFSSISPIPRDLTLLPAILGIGDNNLNFMGWFVGAIFSMYLIFPLISRAIRAHPYLSIIAIAIISFSFRYFVSPSFLTRACPLNNLFEFGLGIFCIQWELYPKNIHDFPLISKIADLTFYIFIFHIVILQSLNDQGYLIYTLAHSTYPAINGIFSAGLYLTGIPVLGYFLVIIEIIIVSMIAMILDKKLQQAIGKRLERNQLIKT